MQNSKVKAKREVKVIDLFKYFYLNLLLFLISIALLIALIKLINLPIWGIVLVILIPIITFVLTIKRFAIGVVLMYKAHAPMSVRDRCRYEPCCSTYMILAIEKYGLFKGMYKGFKRIKRCKPPYGGVDYP